MTDEQTWRELAKAATPGGRIFDESRHHAQNQMVRSADVCLTDIGSRVATVSVTAWKQGHKDARPDARFIAYSSPDRVLALLDELATLRADERDAGALEAENFELWAENGHLAQQLDALTAQLEQLKPKRT